MACLSSFTIYSVFTFEKLWKSNNNEQLVLLFDGLLKVKAKYEALLLNALANFQNASTGSGQPSFDEQLPYL